ncbi:MAG: hypothetical protein WCK67_09475 [bacterium]
MKNQRFVLLAFVLFFIGYTNCHAQTTNIYCELKQSSIITKDQVKILKKQRKVYKKLNDAFNLIQTDIAIAQYYLDNPQRLNKDGLIDIGFIEQYHLYEAYGYAYESFLWGNNDQSYLTNLAFWAIKLEKINDYQKLRNRINDMKTVAFLDDKCEKKLEEIKVREALERQERLIQSANYQKEKYYDSLINIEKEKLNLQKQHYDEMKK